MATRSRIEWTQQTWKPVTGCTNVSPGCKHCYARIFAERLKAMGVPSYENGFAVTLQPERLQEPVKRRKPTLYFVNSMSDLFHEQVPLPMWTECWRSSGRRHAISSRYSQSVQTGCSSTLEGYRSRPMHGLAPRSRTGWPASASTRSCRSACRTSYPSSGSPCSRAHSRPRTSRRAGPQRAATAQADKDRQRPMGSICER